MQALTKMENIQLLAFIKVMVNKDIPETIKEEMTKIYFKLGGK